MMIRRRKKDADQDENYKDRKLINLDWNGIVKIATVVVAVVGSGYGSAKYASNDYKEMGIQIQTGKDENLKLQQQIEIYRLENNSYKFLLDEKLKNINEKLDDINNKIDRIERRGNDR